MDNIHTVFKSPNLDPADAQAETLPPFAVYGTAAVLEATAQAFNSALERVDNFLAGRVDLSDVTLADVAAEARLPGCPDGPTAALYDAIETVREEVADGLVAPEDAERLLRDAAVLEAAWTALAYDPVSGTDILLGGALVILAENADNFRSTLMKAYLVTEMTG